MSGNKLQRINNCKIGKNTKIYDFVNFYDCEIGNGCIIGPFVEIQEGVVIGNNVKIESHTFICTGVELEDDVFVGHHVVFTNDKYPRAISQKGKLKTEKDWKLEKTLIKRNASIGSNATILPGIKIGKNSIVGAGAVVTKDIPSNTIVVGNPAKKIRITKFLDED